MKKLKIRVNGNIDELVDLFKQLGCKYFNHTGSVFNYMFFENGGIYFCKLKKDFDEYECKEITLPQLRDKVVLHRNDVGDANAKDDTLHSLYLSSDGVVYFFHPFHKKWVESEINGKDDLMSKVEKIQGVNVENLISGEEALSKVHTGTVQYICLTNPVKNQWVTITDHFWDQYHLGVFLNKDTTWRFRLKPRTIKIGDVDVPAPFEPKHGDKYYHISIQASLGYGWDEWESSNYDARASIFGAWRTECEIKQVVAALRKLMGVAK